MEDSAYFSTSTVVYYFVKNTDIVVFNYYIDFALFNSLN